MPCHNWLDYAGFGVQCLLFIGLVWYTLESSDVAAFRRRKFM
jgi:hypothetical protein